MARTPAARPGIRPHVAAIETHVKGGSSVPYRLALHPLLLIVGHAASGKSRIPQAVALATSGKADDVAGRDGVAEAGALLASFAPMRGTVDGDAVEATAIFSDGQKATARIARVPDGKGGSKVEKSRTGPTVEMPLREVMGVLRGGTDKARLALLRWACSSANAEEVARLLPLDEATQLRYYAQQDTSRPAADLLAGYIEATEKKAKAAKGDAAEAASEAALWEKKLPAGAGPGAGPGDDTALLGAAFAVAGPSFLGMAVGILAEMAPTTPASLVEAAAHGAPAAAKLKALRALEAVAVRMLTTRPEGAAYVLCPVTDQQCSVIALQQRIEQIRTLIQQTEAGAGAGAAAVDAAADHVATAAAFGALRGAFVERVGANLARQAAGHEAAALMAGLKQIAAAAGAWDAYQAARQRQRAAEEAEAVAKSQLARLEDGAAKLLPTYLPSFLQRVDTYLPENVPAAPMGWKAGVALEMAGRPACRFGLRKLAGTVEYIDTALSGTETATLAAAIAMAITPPGCPALVLPADVDIDAETLAAVMKGFSTFDGQVIMTSTKKPKGKVPGWKVVTVEEIEEQIAAHRAQAQALVSGALRARDGKPGAVRVLTPEELAERDAVDDLPPAFEGALLPPPPAAMPPGLVELTGNPEAMMQGPAPAPAPPQAPLPPAPFPAFSPEEGGYDAQAARAAPPPQWMGPGGAQGY